MTLEEIARITTANAVRLFGLGEVVSRTQSPKGDGLAESPA
jgi:hypothetical protein